MQHHKMKEQKLKREIIGILSLLFSCYHIGHQGARVYRHMIRDAVEAAVTVRTENTTNQFITNKEEVTKLMTQLT